MSFKSLNRTLHLLIVIIIIITFLLSLMSCDQEVSTSPPESEPPQGFVYVESKPPEFQIYLDGRFTGRFTPDSVPFVEETSHNVTLKRELWRDTSFSVSVTEDRLTILDVDYLMNPKMYGSVKFISQPSGAQIVFNDSSLNATTPFTIKHIVPGRYEVECSYPNHRKTTAKIAVESNKTTIATLALQDTSIWVDYTTDNAPLPTNKLMSITIDNTDGIWVGTIDEGFFRNRGNDWKLFNSSNSPLISDRVTVMFADHEDNIWIGTENGLLKYRFNGTSQLFTSDNSNLSNNYITSINQQDDGDVWIGTLVGISRYTNNSFINYSNSQGDLPYGSVRAIEIIDPTYVWAAVDTFLTRMEIDNDYHVFGRNQYEIPNSNPTSIKQCRTGEIWVTFSGQSIFYGPGVSEHIKGGLAIYDGSVWSSIIIGETSTQIPNIFIDSDNIKWVSTSIGLMRFISFNTSSVITFKKNNSGIVSNNVKQVVEDSRGTLWMATFGGLAKYKKNLLAE